MLIALAGAAMLWWSWGTWPDALIDFGRELYIPWQLSQGQVLYRDVAHFNGPLSQHWNALLFKLFGVSLRTLVVGNLVVLGAVLILLYRLLVAVGGRGSATIACLTFAVLFAFSQFTLNGNGNFVCPYSHEITHGILLALAGMAFVGAYVRRRRLIFVALAGLAAGLAFLTKVEVSLAAMAATTVGLALAVGSEDAAARKPVRVAALYLGSMLVPPLIAFLALRTAMPASQALAGTLGSWWYAFNPELAGNEYYKRGLGLLNVEESIGVLWKWTMRYAAVLVASAAVAFYVPKAARTRILLAAGVFGIAVCLLGLNWAAIRWQDALRPLPLVVLGLGVLQARSYLRSRRYPEVEAAKLTSRSQPKRQDAASTQAGRAVLSLSMLAFAFAMMLKMLLNVRIYHYGFALAMPAVMMMATALFDWTPAWIRRRGGSSLMFAAGTMAVWLVAVGVHLYVNVEGYWSHKTVTVSRGADAFRADGRGVFVNAVLAEIAQRLGPEGTLAVFPDGEMLNYLARRRSPTPFIKFAPPEMIMFREASILEAFRAHPPDLIVIVHKDTAEYGVPFFGRDYGCDLWHWITANYRPVRLFGAPPLQDQRFGIAILERLPPGHSTSGIRH